MRYKLSKKQHLCGETAISELFKSGQAFISFPIRVVYKVRPNAEGEKRPLVRVMFSVSKKYFKHAVDRNRYKRIMREAYRIQQDKLNEFLKENGLIIDLSFSAVNNQIPEFLVVKDKISRSITNIIDHIS